MARPKCVATCICTEPTSNHCVGVSDDECKACKVSALLSALEELGGGWMPIETAPKDGTVFDAWIKCWKGHAGYRISILWKNDAWWAYDGYDAMSAAPTHWMPLPPAPKE